MLGNIIRNLRVHANAKRLFQNPGSTEPGANAYDTLHTPLQKLDKKDKPKTIQASSKSNKPFEKIHFKVKKADINSSDLKSLLGTVERVLEFLNETGGRWSKVDPSTGASIEQDVSDRNESELFPFLVDMVNKMLPINFAAAYYTQPRESDGRADSVIVVIRLEEPLDALQLEKANPEDWARIPKNHIWTIAGSVLVGADIQAIYIMEDKYNLKPPSWLGIEGATGPLETQSREIRLYGSQMIKYIRLFACRYITINDGNFYSTYCLDRDQVQALCDATDVNKLPGTLEGTFATSGVEDVRISVFTTIIASLKDKFGDFDGKKWEKGGEPRGAPWFIVDPKGPAGLPKIDKK